GDLQRAHHHRADSARSARRGLPPARRQRRAARERPRVRPRRYRDSVRRDQSDRPHPPSSPPDRSRIVQTPETATRENTLSQLITSVLYTIVTVILFGLVYPLIVTVAGGALF